MKSLIFNFSFLIERSAPYAGPKSPMHPLLILFPAPGMRYCYLYPGSDECDRQRVRTAGEKQDHGDQQRRIRGLRVSAQGHQEDLRIGNGGLHQPRLRDQSFARDKTGQYPARIWSFRRRTGRVSAPLPRARTETGHHYHAHRATAPG